VNAPSPRGPFREFGRYLEIQNLGLNLPFALAFLLIASGGPPSLRVLVLILLAFLFARNAGHSFNRWADRELDRANPRTRDRALVTGRYSPAFAIGFAALNAALLVLVAYLLNPLAFALSPVAVGLVFGYSYTKRLTSLTTVFLGLVEAATPGAIFIAVRGALPPAAVVAVVALLLWGTAFESIHSLGDVAIDRSLGLRSLPARLGIEPSVRLVAALHGTALGLLSLFGFLEGLGLLYYAGLVAIAGVVVSTDLALARAPTAVRAPFRAHFAMSGAFLAGTVGALLAAGHPPL
jgi:4-hydroxybenzoate polyprenyltransferase